MTTRFSAHLLTGDHASRPAASAVPQGTLYACDDHGIIYKSDGVSTWDDWHSNAEGTPGAHALGSHTDVDLTSPATGANLEYDGADWIDALPQVRFVVAVGDETTAITAGTGKRTFRMPCAMTLTAVRANVKTAPTGAGIIIDINEGGTTILSTKLSIDASELTSVTAASAAVISDGALADDAEITIDFDQVGSTIAGAGVKVTFIGRLA